MSSTRKLYVSPKVVNNKRRREQQRWEEILYDCESLGSCSAAAQLYPQVNLRTIQRKFKKFKASNDIKNATTDKRNQYRQTFTVEEETKFAEHLNRLISADIQLINYSTIKTEARLFYQLLHPKQSKLRNVGFTASNGWVDRFKARHGFPSHKLNPVQKLSIATENTQELSVANFINEVVNAVFEYGARYVFNMDETPVKVVEMPRTAWNNSFSHKKLKTRCNGNPKQKVTVMPTITADGKKLPLAWINKAETDYAIKNRMKLPQQIFSYYSDSGWVNEGIMLRWLIEVIKPAIPKRGAALIIDSYDAHWTPAVCECARKMKLRLIEVPKGTTSEYQPLDISVNGPMKRIEQRLFMDHKLNFPESSDTIENAVLRAFNAYNEIGKHTILKGWEQVSPLIVPTKS